MINQKRAKKSVQHWKHESRQARERLLNGEPMDFREFVLPRTKQVEASNRLKRAS